MLEFIGYPLEVADTSESSHGGLPGGRCEKSKTQADPFTFTYTLGKLTPASRSSIDSVNFLAFATIATFIVATSGWKSFLIRFVLEV